jgi:HNH endonuclease
MAYQTNSGRGRHPGRCAECGQEFVGQRNRRYCSMRCAKRAWIEKHPRERLRTSLTLPRQTTVGTCFRCGALFVGQKNRRFCSRRCARATYSETHREARRASRARYRARHPDRIREQQARGTGSRWAYRLLNRDKARAAARRYAERHRDRRRESVRTHRRRFPDSSRLSSANWRRKNPDKHAANSARRRARLLGGGGSHTDKQWQELCLEFGGRCAYCNRLDLKLVRDHVIPLVLGGSNDITNIVPACRGCNQRKGRMPREEFLDILRREESR